jgi:NADH-quinone oxidoreductase subunit L
VSLVGVIPFVGFFSKEQILGAAFSKPDSSLALAVWVVGFITALVTGFYTGRMWWMSFAGKPSPQRPVKHPHEAPSVMLVPVVILAVLATIGGFIQTRALGLGPSLVSDFLAPVSGYAAVGKQTWEESGAAVAIGLVTMLLAGALFVAAMRMRPWSVRFPWAQRLLERKYYFDEIYDYMFVRATDGLARLGLRYVEQPVIDGVVVGTGELAESSAHNLSLTQTGYFRNYVLVFVAGAVVVAILVLTRVSS